jgi:hypothetical protein
MVKSNTALLCPGGMTTDAGTVTSDVSLEVRFTTTFVAVMPFTLTFPCPASTPSPSVAAAGMLRKISGKTGFPVSHHVDQRA